MTLTSRSSATPAPRRRRGSAVFVLLGTAAAIVLSQLNQLLSEVLSSSGHTHSLEQLIGFQALAQDGSWAAWASSRSYTSAEVFIVAWTIADLVFVICYLILGRRLIDRAVAAQNRAVGVALAAQITANTRWARLRQWMCGKCGVVLPQPAADAKPRPLSGRTARILLFTVARLNVARDAGILIVATTIPSLAREHTSGTPAQPIWIVVALLSYGTLAFTVMLIVQFLLGESVGSYVRAVLVRALRALYAQRLVAIVVLAVAVLSLLPYQGLIQQVADVYRGLLQYQNDSKELSFNLVALAADLLAFFLTTFVLVVLGRQRAQRYSTLGPRDDRGDGRYSYWLWFAGAMLVVGTLVAVFSQLRLIDLAVFIPFVLIVAGIPLVSMAIDGNHHHPVTLPPLLRANVSQHSTDVRRAGDALAAGWVAVWILGPFTALLSPLFLAFQGDLGATYATSRGLIVGIEIALLVFVVGAPICVHAILRRHASKKPPSFTRQEKTGDISATTRVWNAFSVVFAPRKLDNPDADKYARWLAIVPLAFSIATIVALGLFPRLIAGWFGPVAVLIALLGSWVALIGLLVVLLGDRKPLAIFQVLRLRSTPVVSLLVIVPLAISFLSSSTQLHEIRVQPHSTPLSSRPTVFDAVGRWNKEQVGCAVQVGGPQGSWVRPMLLVAAQGGGIRAATWTVDILNKIADEGPCAQGATFLSSGASGGSIGLATFRPNPGGTDSTGSLKSDVSTDALAGSQALAAAISGLLDGDLIGGVTGIRTPTSNSVTPSLQVGGSWHDRTALQEMTWESEAPQFAQPYDVKPVRPTGYLLLNSEDANSHCKVVVSQLDLDGKSKTPTAGTDCNEPSATLSNTIDLQDYIGSTCMSYFNWSTAAELSARFPIVSAPGRISNATLARNCLPGTSRDGKKVENPIDDLQLVDGGTAENSAVGTISDLAPQLTAAISTLNATADGTQGKPFVVPILTYLANDAGLDLTTTPNKMSPDALVPFLDDAKGQAALAAPAAWLSRASEGLSQVCVPYGTNQTHDNGASTTASTVGGPPATACTRAVDEVREAITGGVAIVSPSTAPAVSVPLGWSLSDFTQASLQHDANDQAKCGLDGTKGCLAIARYGELGTVLNLFGGSRWPTVSPPPPSIRIP